MSLASTAIAKRIGRNRPIRVRGGSKRDRHGGRKHNTSVVPVGRAGRSLRPGTQNLASSTSVREVIDLSSGRPPFGSGWAGCRGKSILLLLELSVQNARTRLCAALSTLPTAAERRETREDWQRGCPHLDLVVNDPSDNYLYQGLGNGVRSAMIARRMTGRGLCLRKP